MLLISQIQQAIQKRKKRVKTGPPMSYHRTRLEQKHYNSKKKFFRNKKNINPFD